MAITAPIAGAYTGTWNGTAVNYTRQGWNIHFTLKGERIEETDLYGLSLIDICYRGASLTIDCIGKIYGSGTTLPVAAWVSSFGQVYNATFTIGQLASGAVKPLVLTAVSGTPAASSPATFTAAYTMPSPDNDFTYLFDSRAREAPLKFDVLVKDTAGTGTLFTLT
jgi:hypothetical protein